jgi:hypothetical protein
MSLWLFLLLLIECCSVSSFASLRSSKASVEKVHSRRFSFSSHAATVAIADEKPAEVSSGEASIASSTFNLAKSIIGAGVLSLPSGVAFFADEPSAIIPSSIICTVFGIVAAYSFSLIGKICKEYNAKSFQEAWEKSVSPKTAWLISGSITALCFMASLAYSIIIGDSFTSLFQV